MSRGLFLRLTAFMVVSAYGTAWLADHSTTYRHLRIVLPIVVVFGLICGGFLVMHEPHSFMSREDMSDDPERRQQASTFRWIEFVGALSYLLFLALPIALLAEAFKALGV